MRILIRIYLAGFLKSSFTLLILNCVFAALRAHHKKHCTSKHYVPSAIMLTF